MNLDEYAQMYRLEDEHWWFVSRRRLLKRAMDRFPPPAPADRPRRLLDVGCGTGGTLDWIAPLGEVTGLDAEPVALDFCRKRGYGNLLLADATNLPLSQNSIEAVIALDVLEHIPDDHAATREIARVLAPGGMVYITVPAYRSLWSGHDVALMHQRRYVAGEIRSLLERNGLEVVYLTYALTAYFPLVWLIRKTRALLTPSAPPRADVGMTPRSLNGLLRFWLDIEGELALRVPLPFGLTVFAVGRKAAVPHRSRTEAGGA
ncbi:MAG: class I SAM-dependent methyltransferase [Armatimonadaceae bacterium]